jgi:hypothetical protein
MMKRRTVDVLTLEPRDVLVGGPMILGRPETNGHLVMVVTEDGVSKWPRGTQVTVIKWYDGLVEGVVSSPGQRKGTAP